MRRPASYFATVLNWLASTNLPKTLIYIQHRVFFVTQVPYHAIKLIVKSWKKSQGRPNETSCNIFCNSFKLIGVYKSPKNIKLYTIQAVTCHTGDISCNKFEFQVLKKSQGRPNATSCKIFCNRFKVIGVYKSPKNIKYIQYKVLFVTQVPYRTIRAINESCKKSQGRSNETSCNIFCNRLKQIDLCKSGSLIHHDMKIPVSEFPCHYG